MRTWVTINEEDYEVNFTVLDAEVDILEMTPNTTESFTAVNWDKINEKCLDMFEAQDIQPGVLADAYPF